MANISIPGFLAEPEQNPNKSKYTGRLCCDDVQVTGEGADAMVTFTITARQLLDAADSQMLWTDQDVQRGIKPEVAGKVARVLPLSDGYPDSKLYNFNAESADEMTEKLLHGQRLFINPLVWNMRPSNFEAYYDQVERKIYIYGGRIYLPDSHHRHQAIIKASKTFRQAPSDYPKFDLSKQFKVELYFLKREDEGNYFFDKNQRPTPTAKSKAYDLTTVDDLSMLAKRVIELTPSLQGNVNRVTDRLTSRNPDVVTLSTLRESLKLAADVEGMDEAELQGIAHVASSFFHLLANVRREIGLLPVAERKVTRGISLVDAPIMFQGYGALIADFNMAIPSVGFKKATEEWEIKLNRLSSTNRYQEGKWIGDLFDKRNPMWTRLGVIKPGLTGRPTVSNNRAARIQVSRALRAVVNSPSNALDLMQIVN
jgi:DNA-sulfur modification-associated